MGRDTLGLLRAGEVDEMGTILERMVGGNNRLSWILESS